MIKEDNDESGGDFGLSEDYDYEVDDNTDKFKTLSDKTLLYFIENYKPDSNNSKLVGLDQCLNCTILKNLCPKIKTTLDKFHLAAGWISPTTSYIRCCLIS